jgi:nitrile hydratase accessory protein
LSQRESDTTSDPVFAEPWQARAFALALKLSEHGHFSRSEWTQALARELQDVSARGELDDGSHYYDHWLAALETLAIEKGLTSTRLLIERKDAWERAWRRTPHGKPVTLE